MNDNCNEKDYCEIVDPDKKQEEKLARWLKEMGFDKEKDNESGVN